MKPRFSTWPARLTARTFERLYIDQVCGDDEELRTRLEALLRIYKEDQTFLEQPAEGIPVVTKDRIA